MTFRILFLVFLLSSWAHATTVAPMTLETMQQTADIIVYGYVTEQRCVYQQHRIETHSTFYIEQLWKGAYTKPTLTVVTPGGTIGAISQHVDLALHLQPNEPIVLFLMASEQEFIPVGFHQGAFAKQAWQTRWGSLTHFKRALVHVP